jgi:hypothetical protein
MTEAVIETRKKDWWSFSKLAFLGKIFKLK